MKSSKNASSGKRFFLVLRSPPKFEGVKLSAFPGGGRAAPARTWVGRPAFPPRRQLCTGRGMAFWDGVSFPPSLPGGSESGRAPLCALPLRGALLRRRRLDRPGAPPARLRLLVAAASSRVSPLAACLGARLVYPASPPTLPGLRGLSDPNPRFPPKKSVPSEAPNWGQSGDQSPVLRMPACSLPHRAGSAGPARTAGAGG